MIVPSYDIDLMWHSHMMYPQLYRKHTLALVGCVIWHDDSKGLGDAKVVRSPTAPLTVCFGATGEAYKHLFGEFYFILECNNRRHRRPVNWCYEGSVEQMLTKCRPLAIMIASEDPIPPNSNPTDFDAADPLNKMLNDTLITYNARYEASRTQCKEVGVVSALMRHMRIVCCMVCRQATGSQPRSKW